MAIIRTLNPFELVRKKNYFLFGPRSTGKSWLIRSLLPSNAIYIDLISTDVYLRLTSQPSLLESMIKEYKIVVIDEIQKLPILLDEVQRLIEAKNIRFLLTGSSARRLKRESSNMLGGRANQMSLLPLTSYELGEGSSYPDNSQAQPVCHVPPFHLERYLLWGGIPRIYLAEDPFLELEGYLQVYLEQEIQIESHIRNLPPFSRFLKVASLCNGQLINYAAVASDCGVSANTVKEYYQILVDTLLGFTLDPWVESKKRKAISTSKFYFFDLGVRNYISGLNTISPQTKEWGDLFEHFLINEIRAYLIYKQKRLKMYFWRNTSKHEVDLVLGSNVAIEIKATNKVQPTHLKSLQALQEEQMQKRFLVVSNDPIERLDSGIEFFHWKSFIKNLWADQIL